MKEIEDGGPAGIHSRLYGPPGRWLCGRLYEQLDARLLGLFRVQLRGRLRGRLEENA